MSPVPRLLLIALTLTLAAPAARADEDPVAAHFSASYKAEESGEYGRALNEVLEILRAQPSDYVATLRAAWLYYKKGQHEDAAVTYRRAAALSPSSIEARLGLTLPLMALSRWKETAAVCEEIRAKAPGNYLALSRLAYSLFNLGQYAHAATIYERTLSLFPSDTEMMLGLAWADVKRGRKDEAKARFQRVLQLRAASVRARAGLEACVAGR